MKDMKYNVYNNTINTINFKTPSRITYDTYLEIWSFLSGETNINTQFLIINELMK